MRFAPSAVFAAVLVACQTSSTPGDAVRVHSSRAKIAGGVEDTAHLGVVAVLGAIDGRLSTCSGSIVKIDGDVAYVLTAAHCCGISEDGGPAAVPSLVVAADDFDPYIDSIGVTFPKPPAYAVAPASVKTDPQYSSFNHDFCMLQFWGVTPDLVTMQLPSINDGVKASDVVEIVGFGITSTDATGMANATRHRVKSHVEGISPTAIGTGRGSCPGDSGGPTLHPGDALPDLQVVIAVNSRGSTQCDAPDAVGAASRVSSALGPTGFITQYLARPPEPKPDATACTICQEQESGVDGECLTEGRACRELGECVEVKDCFQSCGEDDATCRADCRAQSKRGAGRFDAFFSCVCAGTCADACRNECAPPVEDAGAPDSAPRKPPTVASEDGGATATPPRSSGGCSVGPRGSWQGAAAIGIVLVSCWRRRRPPRTRV